MRFIQVFSKKDAEGKQERKIIRKDVRVSRKSLEMPFGRHRKLRARGKDQVYDSRGTLKKEEV
jgi:hypothetical protein